MKRALFCVTLFLMVVLSLWMPVKALEFLVIRYYGFSAINPTFLTIAFTLHLDFLLFLVYRLIVSVTKWQKND